MSCAKTPGTNGFNGNNPNGNSLRCKLSGLSKGYSKLKLSALVLNNVSIKISDFQPRYVENGKLFGLITLVDVQNYEKCLSMDGMHVDDDIISITPAPDKSCIPTSGVLVFSGIPASASVHSFGNWMRNQSIVPICISFYKYPSYMESDSSLGVAFVQYLNVEDCGKAYGELGDCVFTDPDTHQSHTLTVTFKQKNDLRELSPANEMLFLSDEARNIYDQLVAFKSEFGAKGIENTSLMFDKDLTMEEKLCVYALSERLNLCHGVQGVDQDKRIVVSFIPKGARLSSKTRQRQRSSSVAMDVFNPSFRVREESFESRRTVFSSNAAPFICHPQRLHLHHVLLHSLFLLVP